MRLQAVSPVHDRHHHIQHYQVRIFTFGQLHGLLTVGAGDHVIAVAFQIEADSLDEQSLVIYYQDRHTIPLSPRKLPKILNKS